MIKRKLSIDRSNSIKSYKFNFDKDFNYGMEFIINDKLDVAYKFNFLIRNLPGKIKALYNLSGYRFFYLDNGYLYKTNDDEYSELLYVGENPPVLMEVMKGGKMQTLIIGETVCSFYDGENLTQVYMPKGEFGAVCRGRIVLANSNKIHVGLDYDFNSSSVSGGFFTITLPESAGEVVGLGELKDYVLVVCANAIFKLLPDDELIYKLEDLKIKDLKVEKYTVKEINGDVYFINWSRVCCFNGSKVICIDSLLDKNAFTLQGNAAIMDDKYLLTINTLGYIMLFVYDTTTKRQSFLRSESYVIGDGGYSGSNSKAYCKIEKGVSATKASWNSNYLNFSTNKKKALTGININVSCPTTLRVVGDFGSKYFSLKKGENRKFTNLISRTFKFFINALEYGLTMDYIEFKYKVLEE